MRAHQPLLFAEERDEKMLRLGLRRMPSAAAASIIPATPLALSFAPLKIDLLHPLALPRDRSAR